MGSVLSSNKRTIRDTKLFFLFAGMLLVSNACSVLKIIRDEQPESDFSNVKEAIVVCSDECHDRGQCGLDEEGREFVLMGLASPTLEGHEKAVPANSPVTIVGKEIQPIIEVSSSDSVEMSFYSVILPDSTQGWVADWCID